jgi:transmembrane sensor
MSRKMPGTNRQILEEASTWFVVLRGADLDDAARTEFQEWLKRSPEHIRAYLEIASTYADIPAPEGGRTPADLIERARTSADINVVTLSTGQLAAGGPEPVRSGKPRPGSARLIRTRVLTAAAMLAFVSVGTWLYLGRNAYETGVGEQRSITLPDGSIVELNARSSVRIAYRAQERGIELLSGQALFRVASDKTRPFIVRSDGAQVRAVGTQFDIYRKKTGTVVTVLEGRVAILSASAATAPEPGVPEFLVAGEQATVTPTRAAKTERPNVAAATAWAQHQLVFDGTPLREVIEEFSRYSPRRLVIDSPNLADLKISGQYTSASPESLLKFLSLQPGVVVEQVSGETHIRQE